jgi:hypothetical protein
MKNLVLISVALTFLMFGSAQGQSSKPSPAPQKPASDDVVRTTINLVQLDVVVTDKEGKPVMDLTPEDFEITEDKSKQAITNFSYISLAPTVSISQPDASKTQVAPAPIRPEEVRRTIALVVDDLGLSYDSIASVKQALRKFVNEQMGFYVFTSFYLDILNVNTATICDRFLRYRHRVQRNIHSSYRVEKELELVAARDV